ncbi:nucleolar protein 4-like isoform X2 [Ornithodoros turicata]|uniref:nucleolar protein 4-like isoform X2 n=1 Tax=Ornithodoros turicata TaxID=34597 RepID=UPI00313A310E
MAGEDSRKGLFRFRECRRVYSIKKGSDGETTVYKRVAVVENFYEIIYGVHVEMDGRGGKHAGQKRTYKAIAELYAFLPREAVTHFLMSCSDCQKRMHLSIAGCQGNGSSATSASSPESSREGDDVASPEATPPVEQLDFSVPITTAYLKHMRSLGLSDEEALNPKEESGSDELSDDGVPEEGTEQDMTGQPSWEQKPLNMTARGSTGDHDEGGPSTMQTGDHTPDDMSASTKEEDEEDEDDEKLDSYDPERLKAFNMFVRLFVDENLDRMVPISRQPKEKIQAIIDSCARQFPEFSERARKRIRTYLKSCRRTKRTREGWDGRAAIPHLTSPLAEQILASACESETNNAKRMRLQPPDVEARSSTPGFVQPTNLKRDVTFDSSQLISRLTSDTTNVCPFHHHHSTKAAPPTVVTSVTTLVNGTAPHHHHTCYANGHHHHNGGPTDLSVKKCPGTPLKYSLSPSEVSAVRQLIAGYRESAAFLLRSADELEQLLLQHN